MNKMFKAKLVYIFYVVLFGIVSAENTPTIQELCNLAPGSTILRPNTCSNWVRCPNPPDAADIEEGSCVFGLYFNKDLGMCQYQNEMECPYDTSTTKNRCSRVADGNFIADENNCNVFIYCKDGEELRSNCPGDLVFDPKSGSCVYKSQYTCPKPKPVAQSHPICMSLPSNVTFADQNDCTKYDICIDGDLIHYDCPDGNAWDYLKGICVSLSDVVCLPTAKKPDPENTVCGSKNNTIIGPISDGYSCSGYYFCKKLNDSSHDRHPEHFTCSTGTFFDKNTLSCRDRVNVKCSFDRCEGMGNKYVNVAGNCRAYDLCHNGKSASHGSCPNGYYFDERTQGCTPHVVSYAACSA